MHCQRLSSLPARIEGPVALLRNMAQQPPAGARRASFLSRPFSSQPQPAGSLQDRTRELAGEAVAVGIVAAAGAASVSPGSSEQMLVLQRL